MLNDSVYFSTFYKSSIPTFICGLPDLRILEANLCAVNTYGYSADELKELYLPDLCVENHIAIFRERLQNGDTITEADIPKVVNFLKSDDTIAQVNPRVSFVEVNGSKYLSLSAIDISSEVKTKKELSLANDRLHAAQAIAGLGYWSNNLQTQEVIWSDELYNIFEVDKHAFHLSLDNILSLFDEAERGVFAVNLNKLFATGNTVELEQKITTPNGNKKWIFQRLKVLMDDNGNALLLEGVTLDITSKKTSELKLVKQNKMLSSITRFATNVLSSDNWKAAMEELFHSIQDIIGVDSVCYFENDQGEDIQNKCAECKVRWGNEHTLNHEIERIPFSYIEEAIEIMRHGQPYFADTPNMCDSDIKNTLSQMGISSALMMPTMIGDHFYGFICLHNHNDTRRWDDDELDYMNTVIANLNSVFERTRYKNTASVSITQLESIISNMPGVAMRERFDSEYHVTFISNEVEEISGYPANEFINSNVRSWDSIIHPDDLPAKQNAVRTLVPGGGYQLTYRIICSNGKTKWLASKARSVYGAAGESYIDTVLTDITENILKEKALEESNSKFGLLMKSSTEAIIDWDIANDKVTWGDGFHTFFGYDLATFTREDWQANVHKDDVDATVAAILAVQNDPAKDLVTLDYRFHKANGEVAYVHHRGMYMRDKNGVAYRGLSAMIDLSSTVQHVEMIRQQNDALKNIAWTQSHIVRAPVANILGISYLLEQTEGIPDELKDLVSSLKTTTEGLDIVIKKIVEDSNHIINADV